MKQVISAILFLTFVITLIVVVFTFQQVDREQKSLAADIQKRSDETAHRINDNLKPYMFNTYYSTYLQTLVDKYTNSERLLGVAVYDNKDNLLALSTGFSTEFAKTETLPANIMDADKASGDFSSLDNNSVYDYAIPLHDNKGAVVGSLMIVQNAGYINDRIFDIWKNNLLRLLVQSIAISLAVLFIIYWFISKPIKALAESIKNARNGNIPKGKIANHIFFEPLINEFTSISKSLQEARNIATQEARLRLEKLDSPWTAERLKEFTKDLLKGKNIFVVSNREPYMHIKQGNKISYIQPASGMVTALEPIMRSCGGMWIAHGSGDADKLTVNSHDKIKVPPDDPKYTLKRVWLTKEEEKGYYNGFCNEGLWPLCHTAHTRPVFRKEDWYQYEKVNGKFAQTLLKEIKDVRKPIILIQDFHFALLPKMIKNSRPDAIIGIFWHIPWPNAESFQICPWRREILEGMLGADLLGFHTQLHCNNFIDTVSHELEALVDLELFAVQKEGHVSFIKPFPISIPFLEQEKESTEQVEKNKKEVFEELGIKTKYMGLGVDRLDYTKGLLERLHAVEYFLQTYPAYRKNFTFVQISAPSRTTVPQYAKFAEEVEKEIERINATFRTRDWKPIVFLKKHHTHEQLYKYYKAADFCAVTSLHDGMNLVAKEFIMARSDEKGVLLLSQFAGASRELKDAIIVNPYNIEQTAESFKTALTMMQAEQTKRMKRMREIVQNYNVYRWSAELLKTLMALEN